MPRPRRRHPRDGKRFTSDLLVHLGEQERRIDELEAENARLRRNIDELVRTANLKTSAARVGKTGAKIWELQMPGSCPTCLTGYQSPVVMALVGRRLHYSSSRAVLERQLQENGIRLYVTDNPIDDDGSPAEPTAEGYYRFELPTTPIPEIAPDFMPEDVGG